jgi:hypothetical protein
MRRRRGLFSAITSVIATALVLAGCAAAPTVGDGSLGVTWAVPPTPTVPTPKVGMCTARDGAEPVPRVSWNMSIFSSPGTTVECSVEHLAETYFVGTFPADTETDAAGPPEHGTPRFRFAYETCAERATEFLGGDFHTGRLSIVPVMPSDRQWAGEARWFRCEVMEIVDDLLLTIGPRSETLRDGLRGAKPLALTCANAKLSDDLAHFLTNTFVPCAGAHTSEMTGIYVAPDIDFPGNKAVEDAALDACYGMAATFLGLTRAELDNVLGIRWTFSGGQRELWSVGDRSHRCYVLDYAFRTLTGSSKGRRPPLV